ncbi:FG-GAP repeat domain-containing protein [Nannocystis pusilla]|uniref:FG-GAP repeat domain-containing protein n=1 Tax=Nannocystis pusilla TaxID=889268 RepID=UPI003DA30F8E
MHQQKWMVLAISLLPSACDDVVELEHGATEPEVDRPGQPLADASQAAPGFDAYARRYVTRDPDGTWVVEGDIAFDDEEEVRNYYEQRYAVVDGPACEDGEVCPRSTVAQTSGGRDRVWNAHEKISLSYCIGDMGNQTNRDRVEAAMNEATRAWEHTADINFIHVSGLDGVGCAVGGASDIRFTVSRVGSCSALRLAFADFPGHSSAALNYCDLGLGKSDAELLSITKHELGHLLGLHHEHLRWGQDAGSNCAEDNGIPVRNVTFADSDSIMGYDFCNGMNSGNDDLSRLDYAGMWYLYSVPKGQGTLFGQLYNQYNNFRGYESDDVLWYKPVGGSFSLWSTSESPGTSSTPIAFTKPAIGTTSGTTTASSWSRPLAVQWHNNGDANLAREVLMFAPGTLADQLVVNDNDGTFSTSGMTINGWSIPLLGNFHQGTYTEVLWWSPGNGSLLWRTDGAFGVTQTTATTNYNGGSFYALDFHSKALVGNFDFQGGGGAEILSFNVSDGWVTRGTGTHGFETKHVNLTAAVGGDAYRHIPLLGDFDGDGYGDIFWYGPGSLTDRLNLLGGSLWDDIEGGATVLDHPVSGHYKPFVGDFNGDNRDDIFWYQPGSGGDSIWLFNAAGGYTSVARTVNGDFSPIPGDFNYDGCDDVLWFNAVTNSVTVWRSNCDGGFTEQSHHSAPDDSYPVGYGLGY